MNSNIIVFTTITKNQPSPIFIFCDILNRVLSRIKLCHLFTNSYSSHLVYDDVYKKFGKLFDLLQEELISLNNNELEFPLIENIQFSEFDENSDAYNEYLDCVNILKSVIYNDNVLSFIRNSDRNNINNTLGEIDGVINRSKYLLDKIVKQNEKDIPVTTEINL